MRRSITLWLAIAAIQLSAASQSLAQSQTVSIFIVRHAEGDTSQPTVPLTAAGRQRAEVLAQTLRSVRFTHVFTSHTTRARQTAEPIAAALGLSIVQLPQPGSVFDGKPVTDQTSRRAAIEPVAKALLGLPPGSIALAVLNSENIFAIMNRLGVPVAAAGQPCRPGSMCVQCTDNSCYPKVFDLLWHVVREPGRTEPVAFAEFRYGAGWRPRDR
jgi:hypothetical protein